VGRGGGWGEPPHISAPHRGSEGGKNPNSTPRRGWERPNPPSLFRPALPTALVGAALALDSPESCRLFLAALPLSFTGPDAAAIDCKQSLAVLAHF
uniref:Uncharacterized protein n=1 Tax=Accipiter nisus TaxID=211598 RepID=A0A8B9MNI5_9AVES